MVTTAVLATLFRQLFFSYVNFSLKYESFSGEDEDEKEEGKTILPKTPMWASQPEKQARRANQRS